MENANNERLDDIEGRLTVRVRTLAVLGIEGVTAVEELRDVSTVVVNDVELATRMDAFETIHVEDEVVKDDKLAAFFDFLGNSLGRIGRLFIFFSLDVVVGELDLTSGVLIANAVDGLKDCNEDAEGKQTKDAKDTPLITL